MKQVVQNYSTGELRLEEVPAPICRAGGVVVRAAYSLVSSGTERMKVDQARMNLVQMARARPDKVKQVVQNVKQLGFVETYKKVRERLSSLTPLGYSVAGEVVEVGSGLDEFAVGDRVACAGEGVACHAEFIFVPRNLCVPVPPEVHLKDAAFATVGAIAMNGVRQAGVTVGDSVLVLGLGLVGLLAVQILKAGGCRVIGVDLDSEKTRLAAQCGADLALTRDDPALDDAISRITDGLGPDVAYIAASTKSTDPMELAGRTLRDRGRVVVVGMVPVQAEWQTYYQKELSVVMSRSYGPGRYDRNFEDKGVDYPVGYIRWTERRNLGEFLRLIADRRIDPSLLAPKTFPFSDAPQAYQELHDAPGHHAAGILFEYDRDNQPRRKVELSPAPGVSRVPSAKDRVGVGVIGSGNFATATLIPALKAIAHVDLRGICSARGLSAKSAAQRHGFQYCASDIRELLNDSSVDAVVIATRHDSHAQMASEAARAGKHVFVEKPLALNDEQLEQVIQARAETGVVIMPGYNRRFSPLSVAVRDFFTGRSSPIEVICRVNAGAIARDSWYQDAEEGGWRIVSEGCHFIDLIQYICDCPPVDVYAAMIGGDVAGAQNDNCTVTLHMRDGSLGLLIYVANGEPGFEKERIEVFGQGRTAVIANWHAAWLHGQGSKRKVRPARSGKGHGNEMEAFVDAVRGGREPPLSFDEAIACTRATFAAAASMASRSAHGVVSESIGSATTQTG